MSTNQMFLSLAGLMVTLFGVALAFVKYYIDARIDAVNARIDAVNARIDGVNVRIDSLSTRIDSLESKIDYLTKQMSDLVNYMILHEGKIATLEERTKNL